MPAEHKNRGKIHHHHRKKRNTHRRLPVINPGPGRGATAVTSAPSAHVAQTAISLSLLARARCHAIRRDINPDVRDVSVRESRTSTMFKLCKFLIWYSATRRECVRLGRTHATRHSRSFVLSSSSNRARAPSVCSPYKISSATEIYIRRRSYTSDWHTHELSSLPNGDATAAIMRRV